MSITRWRPRLSDLDEWFEDAFSELPDVFRGQRSLAMDVYETDQDVVVKMDAPGLKPEDVDISVRGNTLVVRGETRSEEEVREENYFRRERRYGSFRRSISLPTGVDADNAEASLSEGTLTITLPKSEEARQKPVPVKGAAAGAQIEGTAREVTGQEQATSTTTRVRAHEELLPGRPVSSSSDRLRQGASRSGSPDINEPGAGSEVPPEPEHRGWPSATVLEGTVHLDPTAQEGGGEPRIEGSGEVVGNIPRDRVQLDEAEATGEGHGQPGEVGHHVREESGSSIGEDTTPIWFEERSEEEDKGARGAWSEMTEEDEVDQELDDYTERKRPPRMETDRPGQKWRRGIPNPEPSGLAGDPGYEGKQSTTFAHRTGEGSNVPGAPNPRVDEGLDEDAFDLLSGGPEDADLPGEVYDEFEDVDALSNYDQEDTEKRIDATRRRMEHGFRAGKAMGHRQQVLGPYEADLDELEDEEISDFEFEDKAEDEWNFVELDEELDEEIEDEDIM